MQYHLRRLLVFTKDSHLAIVGLGELWVPSTRMKYNMLMTKLFTIMVQLRDNNSLDDKPIVNVLNDLHLGLANALDSFISYVRHQQDGDTNDGDHVHIHKVLSHQLLQLNFIFMDQPSLGTTSIIDILIVEHEKPNEHCSLQSNCASLLVDLMHFVT
jgi:hypothetical protein